MVPKVVVVHKLDCNYINIECYTMNLNDLDYFSVDFDHFNRKRHF
jgi:hypothetical protein